MKRSLMGIWYGLCQHVLAMKRVARKKKIETLASGILLVCIITVLILPSPGRVRNFGSTARNLFTLVEGDYLNPLVSSARAVTILNCATDGVARFAGYDDFNTRVIISNKPSVVNMTRYNGSLLSLLNIEFERSAPVSEREPSIYISESFWTKAFGRREDIIGISLVFYDRTYRICGVTKGYTGLLAKTDVWLPVSGRGVFGRMGSMRVLGALHAGSDWRTAQHQLTRCFDELIPDQPYNAVAGAKLLPFEQSLYLRDATPPIAIAAL